MQRWLPTIIAVALIVAIGVIIAAQLVAARGSSGQTGGAPLAAALPVTAPAPIEVAGPEPAPRRIRFQATLIEPTYTVVAGDTLSAIAQRHSTSVDALVGINNLPDRNVTLRVGQRLILP